MLSGKHMYNIYDDVIHCVRRHRHILNSTNILFCSVWGQTSKFKDDQYFRLNGTSQSGLCPTSSMLYMSIKINDSHMTKWYQMTQQLQYWVLP